MPPEALSTGAVLAGFSWADLHHWVVDYNRAPVHALVVVGLLVAQGLMMKRFLSDPVRHALWYSGFGVPLYVLGMLVSAFALAGLEG